MNERTGSQGKSELNNKHKVVDARVSKRRNNEMGAENSERIRELEAENIRLKEDCKGMRLENDALKIAIEKNKLSS